MRKNLFTVRVMPDP